VLAFLLLSTVCSLVASAVLGVRLLRLARRTHEAPELVIGASFLVAGVLGYVLTIAGRPGAEGFPPAVAARLFGLGYACISVGVVLTYVFNWLVFQRSSRAATLATALASALVLATIAPMIVSRTGGTPGGWIDWVGNASRMGSGVWGAWIAFVHYRRARLRVPLGLADPVVANRFLLWSVTMASTFVIFLATSIGMGADGSRMSAPHIAIISTLTLVAAVAQWLAFFAPQAYLRRVREAPAAS